MFTFEYLLEPLVIQYFLLNEIPYARLYLIYIVLRKKGIDEVLFRK